MTRVPTSPTLSSRVTRSPWRSETSISPGIRAARLVRSSVEREFIIIGEAAAALARFAPTIFGAITRARRVVDFRNRLTHEYAAVDDALVWAVVEHDVPVLGRECAALIRGVAPADDAD